ncbi:hypothetical protein NSA56_01940 [Oceanobacillus caeni]|uniref:hypothetical protein n=1 Tax=Oceanobacillus caeni TaxID=405946 RepID=UPI00214A82B8|nr:hypothetical protein [Oceanobacillus caeni]MCR1833158.1 hypothetical protein [Oceanobacillus caeni]
MVVDRNERFNLLMEMKRKEIKVKDIANYLGCSSALVSLFLRDKGNMSEDKIIRLKEYIKSKHEYEYITNRVIVK